jgi:anthranilate 3-monooxygenase (FAD)/4-hydroxyphenylacetate 3-monooxygenase
MGVRTGAELVAGLRKQPREVWLRGRRVEDVTTHPAFVGPLARLAALYDLQHDPAHRDVLTYPSPTSGQPVATAFMVPRNQADLAKRRRAFRVVAEATLGLMGRSPDFLNTTLMAFAEAQDVFGRGGARYADNVVRYYEHVRERDLFLTHALITPQIDRARSSAQQAEAFLHLGVVRETADGLVVRGARMLATLAPLADELAIYNLPGLKPGDEPHAVVFAIPMDTPGLRFVCREPFDEGGRSAFDHPLASSFEEADALVVFEDVRVPWERVFLYGDVGLCNALYPDTNLRQHTAHQTAVRGLVKMQFAVGVAMAVARAIKADTFLHVQEMLGECVAYLELIKSCIVRAEVEHEVTRWGTVRARFEPLQTLRIFLPRVYPRVIEILQTIGAGGLLAMPAAEDFGSEIGPLVERYYQGAEGLPAVDRVRLYKVAWDLAGDAFGSRQLQYERYYAGDPVRNTAGTYLGYDTSECLALVERALRLAGDPRRDAPS